MAIRNILINTPDVERSAAFYQRFLGALSVGEIDSDHAVLDLVTATFELRRVDEPDESTWSTDDLVKGFRHTGFKVAEVDPLVEALRGAGVPFHLDPLEAEGGVRIAFFFAPEGTLLELVQRDLQYHVVHDEVGVARERALGVPERPRFDHIAVTVEDEAATEEFYRPFGFARIGTIEQEWDPRGYHLDFLKSGDTVLEIFSYDVPKHPRAPQLSAPGFVAAVLDGPQEGAPADAIEVGRTAAGTTVVSDRDGFPFTLVTEAALG
ncbi:VOC family protein [Gryllotalpicola reticulitermitis]|uniref:VOC family protein n=1 Tax=Gryllotalpicola reticulitermitis TaxID=1184153 RepID=A0ABV8Q2H1_9MICO